MFARAVPAVFCLLILSCGTPVTQLVAVVETDMGVPDEVASIRVRSLRADADVEEELSSVTVPLDGSTSLPITVAVEPFDLMDVGRVIIEVEAQSPMGTRVVAQRATTAFREGDQLALPMELRESCRRVMCPAGNTCGATGCRSQEVDVGSLGAFEGMPDAP